MGLTIFQVDAFTNKPFAGNPAGVCLLPEPQDAGWMQNIAREMNLSETAFLLRQDGGYNLRWFTPAVEVDLCGHATLASAHILWEAGHLPAGEQARFHTRSGLLTADRRGEWIEMNFPAKPEEPASAPPGLAEALGVPVKYTGKSQFDYLVEVDSEDIVRNMQPDFTLLAKVPTRGVIVTSLAGSAHCCLSPFWSKRLGKNELVGYQASARGGVVGVRLSGDRVYLGGQAVTVLRGELV